MKKAAIEILFEDEKVLDSKTSGGYMVVYYDDDHKGEQEEIGGSFYETIEEAEASVREYQANEGPFNEE